MLSSGPGHMQQLPASAKYCSELVALQRPIARPLSSGFAGLTTRELVSAVWTFVCVFSWRHSTSLRLQSLEFGVVSSKVKQIAGRQG